MTLLSIKAFIEGQTPFFSLTWTIGKGVTAVGQDTGASAPNWLEGGRKASTVDLHQRTAVCKEEIGLELDIQNPLMSEIHISRLRASVEASTSSDVQVMGFVYTGTPVD